MTHNVVLALALAASLALTACEPRPAAENLQDLRADIEALKEGQAAMRKDLETIKGLLQRKKRTLVGDSDIVLDVKDDPVKGNPDAALTLVEFTDYQCPYCGRHARSTWPKLLKDYVDSGKVRYVLRDFPLASHADAKNAAYAAHCAGEQDKYWDMHDRLFANQRNLGADALTEHAKAIAIDVGAFQACLDSGRYKDKVERSIADGRKALISGTPSFLLGRSQTNGQEVKAEKIIRGAAGYGTFKTTIDAMLNGKQ